MVGAPEGTVTLLFTDIEGSTRLLREAGDGYADLLLTHRRLLREVFAAHGGYEVDTEGDAFFVAFGSASQAVAAAEAAQRALANFEWPAGQRVWVRMGIHTGEPQFFEGNYIGLDVHQAARVMAAGHGGQVLVSQSTRDLLNDRVALRNLGEHRLKDLSHRQPLYQLDVDGLPTEFPALKTLESRPTNLPVQPTSLIGRERELAEVAALLRSNVRLVTLTGPGGTGKTRLALQAAADVVEEFEDGVYFVALAPIKTADGVIAAVARAMGLHEQAGRALSETLHEHLGQKRLLLLLDNFEQVTAAAPEVSAVLAAAPRTVVVVTSRSPLLVTGEHLYPVPTLTLPTVDREGGVGGLLESEAIRLFVERARAGWPSFEITDSNAFALAEICRRLDGLPLAIELAAARVRLLSPEAMLGRLDHRLRLLTGGNSDLDPRQQTLRATIEWSYDLLSSAEQLLFARLAVFAGGCRLDAAEAVCDPAMRLGIDVFEGLASLLDKSLLRRRDDPDGEPRFWMLETIREYAQSLQQVRRQEEQRLAEHLRAELERDGEDLHRGVPLLLSRYDGETPNISASLRYLRDSGSSDELLRLIAALRRYWISRSLVREGAQWLELAVADAAFASAPPELKAELLDGASAMAYFSDRLQLAIERLQERLKIEQQLGDPKPVSQTLSNLGLVANQLGLREESDAYFRQSLTLSRRQSDHAGLGATLSNYSLNALDREEYEQAVALTEEAIPLLRMTKDERHLTIAICNYACALYELGDISRSFSALREFSERSFQNNDLAGWAGACTLGARATARDAPHRAARLLGACRQFHEDSGVALPPNIAEAYNRHKADSCAVLGAEAFDHHEADGRRMTPRETLSLLEEIASAHDSTKNVLK